MLEKLKSMLRSDDLLPSLSVFPEIDAEKLRRDLDLDAIGKQRGGNNDPKPEETTLDSVELAVIGRIGSLRTKGLENYEAHRQVYNERLTRAGTMRQEVFVAAENASSNYLTAVRARKAIMTASTERLHETFQHRKYFREKHDLHRPAKHFEGWGNFVGLTIIFIVVESSLNSFMFSRGNEQGLLGGLLTAVVFSAVNVITSTLLGVWACGLNHSAFLRRAAGLISICSWLAFMLSLNLTVAHFRDLIDAETEWSRALMLAVPAMRENPFGLTSMDSWFLLAIGSLISLFAFLKGWYAFDPFPGYSKIERDLQSARASHGHDLEEAIGELEDMRKDALEELRDADVSVREGISHAIDALYGRTTLNSHLHAFLGQCDEKANYLLAIYRDANKAARGQPTPVSFSTMHSYPAFETSFPADDLRRKEAETEAKAVSEVVGKAVKEIFEAYNGAIVAFKLPEEVQAGAPGTPKSPALPDGAVGLN
ncbi:hypothetical protein [Pseudogemmobacter bohemicus]|uniref:hypothetical protein n=1 Tax=Pseudogemmobacter bohemicus TaxID=2250708 RepID=UPI000DD4D21E|nr:hypothetical protein [Pseudogemmobacter bohemicus]